jgi:hypothetical protein
MAYLLPRAIIVLIGWGTSYWLLTLLSTHVSPAVVYFTAIGWALAGVVCFGYLYKLRREAGIGPFRSTDSGRHPT